MSNCFLCTGGVKLILQEQSKAPPRAKNSQKIPQSRTEVKSMKKRKVSVGDWSQLLSPQLREAIFSKSGRSCLPNIKWSLQQDGPLWFAIWWAYFLFKHHRAYESVVRLYTIFLHKAENYRTLRPDICKWFRAELICMSEWSLQSLRSRFLDLTPSCIQVSKFKEDRTACHEAFKACHKDFWRHSL